MKLIVAYASIEGQSEKIALRIASALEADGAFVQLVDTIEHPETGIASDVEGIVAGGPLHQEHHPEALASWLVTHREQLSGIPFAFFSVSLSAASDRQQDLDDAGDVMQAFLKKLQLSPALKTTIAGALKYSKYGFIKKRIMRNIVKKSGGRDLDMSRDYEYTDWKQVDEFAKEFLGLLGGEA